MKKLLTIAGILMGNVVWGQLTPEHTYTANTYVHIENIEGEGRKYILFSGNNDAHIYNLDHSLFKSITTNAPGTTGNSTNFYFSKTLFNSDSKIEFIFSTFVGGAYTTYLYNEDGQKLQEFADASNFIVSNADGSYKLITGGFNGSSTKSTIWSLPGQYLGLTPEPRIYRDTEIYPNPFETAATINYTLPDGQKQSILRIYNTAGVLVKQMTVTDQFKNINIQRDDLPSGNYIYEIAGSKQQFTIK